MIMAFSSMQLLCICISNIRTLLQSCCNVVLHTQLVETKQQALSRILQVRYNERFVEELHLPVEKLDFGEAKPQTPQQGEAGVKAWLPVARPVLQQDLGSALPRLVTSTPRASQVPAPPNVIITGHHHGDQSTLTC